MAITQPNIYKIPAFDAGLIDSDNSPEILFGVISTTDISTSLTNATINIYNNIGDIEVIQGGVQNVPLTYKPAPISDPNVGLYVYSFQIPEEFVSIDTPLENGSVYYITVTITSGGTTLTSNGVIFYCYTEPLITFDNIPINYLAQKKFSVKFSYEQNEGELLNWYICRIYRFNKPNYQGVWNNSNEYNSNLIVSYYNNTSLLLEFYRSLQPVPASININDTSYWELYTPIVSDITLYEESGKLYDDNYQYEFDNLNNGDAYLLEMEYNTIQGTVGNVYSNKYFAISLNEVYNSPLISLNNVCKKGYIEIKSRILDIPGQPTPSTLQPSQTGLIDLRNVGYNINWHDGLVINGDFTMGIWGYDFNSNSKIVTLYNYPETQYNKIDIWYIDDYETPGNIKIALYCYNDLQYPMYLESNSIVEPTSDEQLYVGIQRSGTLFNINVINLGNI